MARRLGLVSWTERRVRAAWRWLRTSNRYVLELPDEPVQRGLRPAWPLRCTNGQFGCVGERSKKEDAQEERQAALASMLRAAAAMPDLLGGAPEGNGDAVAAALGLNPSAANPAALFGPCKVSGPPGNNFRQLIFALEPAPCLRRSHDQLEDHEPCRVL